MLNVHVGCNENSHVLHMSCNANSHVRNPNLQIKMYEAGQEIMYYQSCKSIMFWLTSIRNCPFVSRHIECQYLDGEVKFRLITAL